MSSPKNTTYARVYSMALEIFKYDKDKTHAWWLSKNPVLDGKAPYEMVKEGKGRTLIKLFNRCFI
jgi:uncharacterized protein (DUF2384 family)